MSSPARKLARGWNVLFGSRHANRFSRWQHYFTPRTVAGYIGWVGHDNLGDEALYQSFRQLFADLELLHYEQRRIEHYLHGLTLGRGPFYSLVFLGGGTLVNARAYYGPFSRAVRSGTPTAVFGTGVQGADFYTADGPNTDFARCAAGWAAVLKDAAYVGVRGPHSADRLEAAGLPRPEVIGDPAISLCTPRAPAEGARSGVVAVNVGCDGRMWGTQEHVSEVLEQVARHFLDKGRPVELVPMHPRDEKLSDDLAARVGPDRATVWRGYRDVSATLRRIREYDLLIGQRLHAAILACASGVPSVMLAYQPKCLDFAASIGTELLTARTDELRAEAVLTMVESIESDYRNHCDQLNLRCDQLRAAQRAAAERVCGLVSRGTGFQPVHSTRPPPPPFSSARRANTARI